MHYRCGLNYLLFYALLLPVVRRDHSEMIDSMTMQKLNRESLLALEVENPALPCNCALGPCPGWESFTEERWPRAKMRQLGTLRDPGVYEPTQEEHHPDGTRYASPEAPMALAFFPCNVSDVYACDTCKRVLLRYTEFGGYYVDHRVRELDLKLVV